MTIYDVTTFGVGVGGGDTTGFTDTTAINAAIAAMATSGSPGTLYFPANTYYVFSGTPVLALANFTRVLGDGPDLSIIAVAPNGASPPQFPMTIFGNANTTNPDGLVLMDIGLNGSQAALGNGIPNVGGDFSATGAPGSDNALHFERVKFSDFAGTGLIETNIHGTTVMDCDFEDCTQAITFQSDRTRIVLSKFYGSSDYGGLGNNGISFAGDYFEIAHNQFEYLAQSSSVTTCAPISNTGEVPARYGSIDNNSLVNCGSSHVTTHSSAIQVGYDTSPVDVAVANNVIYNFTSDDSDSIGPICGIWINNALQCQVTNNIVDGVHASIGTEGIRVTTPGSTPSDSMTQVLGNYVNDATDALIQLFGSRLLVANNYVSMDEFTEEGIILTSISGDITGNIVSNNFVQGWGDYSITASDAYVASHDNGLNTDSLTGTENLTVNTTSGYTSSGGYIVVQSGATGIDEVLIRYESTDATHFINCTAMSGASYVLSSVNNDFYEQWERFNYGIFATAAFGYSQSDLTVVGNQIRDTLGFGIELESVLNSLIADNSFDSAAGDSVSLMPVVHLDANSNLNEVRDNRVTESWYAMGPGSTTTSAMTPFSVCDENTVSYAPNRVILNGQTIRQHKNVGVASNVRGAYTAPITASATLDNQDEFVVISGSGITITLPTMNPAIGQKVHLINIGSSNVTVAGPTNGICLAGALSSTVTITTGWSAGAASFFWDGSKWQGYL